MKGAIALSPAPTEAAGLAQLAIVKGLAALGRGSVNSLAERLASPRVTKAVAAMTTGNAADLVDMQIIVSAFVQQLRNHSAFYRLLDGMVRVPFRTQVSMISADATAWIVGEGKPIPVTGAALKALRLDPKKAAALLVMTEELLRATQSERNMTLALRRAISAAADGRFFNLVIDAATPTTPSSGPLAANAVADIKALLSAVPLRTESAPLLVMSPEVQVSAATLTNVSGNFQFPNLTVTGGDILGIPVVPSEQIGAGRVALFDGAGIAGESGTIDIEASAQADIEMLATALEQDSGVPAHATLVSMFQTNSVAIRAVVDFDATRLRDDAVAVLSGVEWGED